MIYNRAQKTAERLLKQYSQGEGVLYAVTQGGTPWEPTAGAEVMHRFDYAKAPAGMMQTYRDSGSIVQDDLLITAAGLREAPQLGQRVTLDGVSYQIIMADPATLKAGAPVVWRLGLRA